jgi:hypothetical protein
MNQDFLDLLRAFIDGEVRFLIVGAYALGWFGSLAGGVDHRLRVCECAAGPPLPTLGFDAGRGRLPRRAPWFSIGVPAARWSPGSS